MILNFIYQILERDEIRIKHLILYLILNKNNLRLRLPKSVRLRARKQNNKYIEFITLLTLSQYTRVHLNNTQTEVVCSSRRQYLAMSRLPYI